MTTSTKVTFGKLCTPGTVQVKEHGSEAKAKQFLAKIKSDKLRKGYKEVAQADSVPMQDVDMKEAEPETPQKKKRPAAIDEEPPKKQQKTLPNYIPCAKRTTKSGAPCFKGCVFVRTGRFNYQKALKDLVESYGVEFIKNGNKATHCLDGGAEMFNGHLTENARKVLSKLGAVVPLPVEFPGGPGDEADAAYLAKSMEISEAIAKQEFRENVPCKHFRAALANAFVKDSDLMLTASSAYPRPHQLKCIEEEGKKLFESMEATP
jgi:predicted DNA-binding WGR domain protein